MHNNNNTHIWEHASKKNHRELINRMLEDQGFIIKVSSLKKFERMNKNTLKQMYNLIRYETNSGHVENDLFLLYGIHVITD